MKLQVQIVSDVVCPWCYIGKVNWDQGSKEFLQTIPGVEMEVEMKPFRLDPTLPMEGKPRDEVLAAKFGGSDKMDTIFARTISAAETSGIHMEFKKGIQQPNTLHSHRLIRLAKDYNLQAEMAVSLFSAYFTDNKDLSKVDILTSIAISIGLDATVLQNFWDTNQYLDETVEEEDRVRSLGVTGVPFFIINDKYAFSGAQPPEVMKNILMEISEKENGAAQ